MCFRTSIVRFSLLPISTHNTNDFLIALLLSKKITIEHQRAPLARQEIGNFCQFLVSLQRKLHLRLSVFQAFSRPPQDGSTPFLPLPHFGTFAQDTVKVGGNFWRVHNKRTHAVEGFSFDKREKSLSSKKII